MNMLHQQVKINPNSSSDIHLRKNGEGHWSEHEHQLFLKALVQFGKDWKDVQSVIKTRKGSQIRSHAQKFFMKLAKIRKEKKKNQYRKIKNIYQVEKQITSMFSEEDITTMTPPEIINIITNKNTQIQFISHEKKSKNNHNNIIRPVVSPKQFLVQENDEKVMIIPDEESESYLVKLIKSNPNCLKTGQNFNNLIDFGKNLEETEKIPNEMQADPIYAERKSSFRLFHEPEDAIPSNNEHA